MEVGVVAIYTFGAAQNVDNSSYTHCGTGHIKRQN